MARAIRNHEGDVYEPFAGSGTTVIAAEQLNRLAFAIEIEPAYCDVVVMRWEQLTGGKAGTVRKAYDSYANSPVSILLRADELGVG